MALSKQIGVYKTDKKLLELVDMLNPAPTNMYAHLHARGDAVPGGTKIYSNVRVVLQDYTAGTGASLKRATANLSPEELRYIYSRLYNGVKEFEFRTDKIFGAPDKDGRSMVTKLLIKRGDIGSDGKPRRYPWYVEIENGTGVPAKGASGGTYCQSGTFASTAKIFINISEIDFFKLFCQAVSFLNVWEQRYGDDLLRIMETMADTDDES